MTESNEVEAQFEGKETLRSSELVSFSTAVFVATPSGNSAVLWDPETDEVIRRFEGHGGSVTGLDFSPDGRMLVTASDVFIDVETLKAGERSSSGSMMWRHAAASEGLRS